MNVLIPSNFIPERKYILNILLSDFLGLEINIKIYERKDYTILLNNGNKIIVQDSFFSNINEKSGYLYEKHLPSELLFSKNIFTSEENIPIIYGNKTLEITENEVICGIDIFASSFFMLTRWEEYVCNQKDKHDRFPDELSFTQKNKIHYRPVVNEYIEMLWNILKFINISQERKKQTYKPIITHDIDFAIKFKNFYSLIKTLGGDTIRRRNPLLIPKTIKQYYNIKKNNEKDIYDTYNYLIDVSEKNNLKSHFYFIPALKGEEDAQYNITDKRLEKIIQNILKRGHLIGLHGTYNSYNKLTNFKIELERLKSISSKITEGRQHFLRFQIPETWQIWEDNNMLIDSTMGYSNDGGFRAGTCYEYNIFNILTRKKLNLKERTLIAMEQAIRKKSCNKTDFIDKLIELSNTCKKYSGNYVFLWHNSNFFSPEWKEYAAEYTKLISIFSDDK